MASRGESTRLQILPANSKKKEDRTSIGTTTTVATATTTTTAPTTTTTTTTARATTTTKTVKIIGAKKDAAPTPAAAASSSSVTWWLAKIKTFRDLVDEFQFEPIYLRFSGKDAKESPSGFGLYASQQPWITWTHFSEDDDCQTVFSDQDRPRQQSSKQDEPECEYLEFNGFDFIRCLSEKKSASATLASTSVSASTSSVVAASSSSSTHGSEIEKSPKSRKKYFGIRYVFNSQKLLFWNKRWFSIPATPVKKLPFHFINQNIVSNELKFTVELKKPRVLGIDLHTLSLLGGGRSTLLQVNQQHMKISSRIPDHHKFRGETNITYQLQPQQKQQHQQNTPRVGDLNIECFNCEKTQLLQPPQIKHTITNLPETVYRKFAEVDYVVWTLTQQRCRCDFFALLSSDDDDDDDDDNDDNNNDTAKTKPKQYRLVFRCESFLS